MTQPEKSNALERAQRNLDKALVCAKIAVVFASLAVLCEVAALVVKLA